MTSKLLRPGVPLKSDTVLITGSNPTVSETGIRDLVKPAKIVRVAIGPESGGKSQVLVRLNNSLGARKLASAENVRLGDENLTVTLCPPDTVVNQAFFTAQSALERDVIPPSATASQGSASSLASSSSQSLPVADINTNAITRPDLPTRLQLLPIPTTPNPPSERVALDPQSIDEVTNIELGQATTTMRSLIRDVEVAVDEAKSLARRHDESVAAALTSIRSRLDALEAGPPAYSAPAPTPAPAPAPGKPARATGRGSILPSVLTRSKKANADVAVPSKPKRKGILGKRGISSTGIDSENVINTDVTGPPALRRSSRVSTGTVAESPARGRLYVVNL